MTSGATVYIVDDEPSVRRALQVVVESAGMPAETFASAEEFAQKYRAPARGCLVLDVRLGGMSGLQLLDLLRKEQIKLPTVMISGHGSIQTAVQSMKSGAVDFLEKPVAHDQLVDKIRDVMKRGDEEASEGNGESLASLTPREIQIVKMLIAGKSSKQIASELQVAYRTVCSHRAHLLAKTGAANTAALVRIAIGAGLGNGE
jgi:FixJ family two-component response regulator